MKNIKNVLIVLTIIVLTIIIFPVKKVDAFPLCTGAKKRELISLASKVKFQYELIDEDGDVHFKVKAVNVDEKLDIEHNSQRYGGVTGSDGISIGDYYEGGETLHFAIYASKGITCAGELLTKKELKIPRFNKYSKLDECIEYEEFPLCDRYYQGEIKDYEEFRTKLREYKQKVDVKAPENVDKRNIFEKFIDLYTDNIEISVILTGILAIILVVFLGKKIYQKSKSVKLRG